MLSILDLFTEQVPLLSPSQISNQLNLTRPTAYRYLKELTQAGLLTSTNGHYGLGPRIIQLDYQMRNADPMLRDGETSVRALAEQFGGTVLLTAMYGDTIVNTHQIDGTAEVTVKFGRGHVMPLAVSATSKILLANMRRTALKKLYTKYGQTRDFQKIGNDWSSFLTSMNSVRARGHHISFAELDDALVGIAAPIATSEGHVANAITLILHQDQFDLFNQQAIIVALKQSAEHLQRNINTPKKEEAAENLAV